jgi:DNA-binding response OmpR family regulator
MRISWASLPRLYPVAPHDVGPSPPGAKPAAKRTFTPKTFAVQGPRHSVALQEREWDLLSLLFEYRGSYLTRETILSRIWGPYYISQTKMLEETLKSLRAAMCHAGYPRDMIRTERDVGIGVPGLDGESLQSRRV